MNYQTANICKNDTVCKIPYPHTHETSSIDSPAIPAKWPDRIFWKQPLSTSYRNPYRLFQFGWFNSHSNFQLPWKLNLDNLGCDSGPDSDWNDVANIISWKFAFRSVYGVPRGGTALAGCLEKFAEPETTYPILIVDDVLTTGNSMEAARKKLNLNPPDVIGVVVAARGICPNWVWPILTVNEWAQSRATGLS